MCVCLHLVYLFSDVVFLFFYLFIFIFQESVDFGGSIWSDWGGLFVLVAVRVTACECCVICLALIISLGLCFIVGHWCFVLP